MSWDKGFNFRATSGFVTDGINETYVFKTDIYPVTRNGSTFGWQTVSPPLDYNRDSGLDRRLAGGNSEANFWSTETFRVDLYEASGGVYDIALALGDILNNSISYVIFFDKTTQFADIYTDPHNANQYVDAAGTKHASAGAWVSSRKPRRRTFINDRLRVQIGAFWPGVGWTPICHLRLTKPKINLNLIDLKSDLGELQ